MCLFIDLCRRQCAKFAVHACCHGKHPSSGVKSAWRHYCKTFLTSSVKTEKLQNFPLHAERKQKSFTLFSLTPMALIISPSRSQQNKADLILVESAFLSALTTYILTIPSPVEYKELYDCSEYFMNFSLTDNSTVIPRDNLTNRRARGVLISLWVVRAVVFFLTQEYTNYIKVCMVPNLNCIIRCMVPTLNCIKVHGSYLKVYQGTWFPT